MVKVVMSDGRFRFGLHFWQLPVDSWVDQVRRYEQLGFSSITFTDHQVVPQWEPLTALGAVAAVTETVRVGTLVLDMALRNPVLTAKSAATVERLSGGRLELGLGAGYVAKNFAAAGVPFASAAERIARLEESLVLMRQLWTEPSTTLHGRYFEVSEAPMVASEPVWPSILVGGGGPTMMRLAGRVADIVSILPRQRTGDWSVRDSLADSTLDHMAQKAAWVRDSAEASNRDRTEIELHTMVVRTIVGDDVAAAVARESDETGVPAREMMDSTLYLVGNGAEVRDELQRWRQRTGISYVSLFDPGDEQIEYLAHEVVAPLNGR
jgi:probable F420-dependent oxidoreductase